MNNVTDFMEYREKKKSEAVQLEIVLAYQDATNCTIGMDIDKAMEIQQKCVSKYRESKNE